MTTKAEVKEEILKNIQLLHPTLTRYKIHPDTIDKLSELWLEKIQINNKITDLLDSIYPKGKIQ